MEIVHRGRSLGEVNGGIEGRAPVLGAAETVRLVVVPTLGHPGELALEHEAFLGRPVDRVLVERVAEVDHPRPRGPRIAGDAGAQHEAGEQNGRKTGAEGAHAPTVASRCQVREAR